MKICIFLAFIFSILTTGCSPDEPGGQKKSSGKIENTKAIATESEILKIAKSIVNEKGNINQTYNSRFEKDANGIPLLVWAVSNQDIEAVKYMLKNGADPNVSLMARSTETAIFESTPSVDIETTQEAYMNRREKTNEICKILIQAGADVRHKSKIKETIFHKAAGRGRDDICALVIENGADIKAKDVIGNTPLHLAAKYGSCKVVELLIKKGADVNDENLMKKTPLSLAEERLDQDLHKDVRKEITEAYPFHNYDKVIQLLKNAGGH